MFEGYGLSNLVSITLHYISLELLMLTNTFVDEFHKLVSVLYITFQYMSNESIILIITLIILIWQTIELKKSTRIQAYQNVLSNYINCINAKNEPLYEEFFKKDIVNHDIENEDVITFAILMNTFEMLYIQKNQKVISNDVWIPWKNYFIKLINIKPAYKLMWSKLKDLEWYNKDITKIINEECQLN